MIVMQAFCNTLGDFHMEKTEVIPMEKTSAGYIFTMSQAFKRGSK